MKPNIDKLTSSLQNFNIGIIDKVRVIPSSGNNAIKIFTNKDVYLLRLSPLDPFRSRSEGELQAEADYIEYLYNNKLPVKQYIKNNKDKYIVKYNNQKGLLRKFDNAGSVKGITNEHIKKVAKTLAEIHNVSEGFKTNNKRMHVWGVDITKKHFRDDEQILIEKMANGNDYCQKFRSLIRSIKIKDLPMGMIHEDLGSRHVLWNKNTISSIIDFDRCYYGYLVLDLAQAVRGWCLNDNKCLDNKKLNLFLCEYQKTRHLSRNELEALQGAVIFAFLERSLSFALRSVSLKNISFEKYAFELLDIAESSYSWLSVL